MAQVYFKQGMSDTAFFEVFIRTLPEHWGFFVMAGLPELKRYIEEFVFTDEDIDYLRTIGIFSEEFLDHLKNLSPEVSLRAFPEGTVFFPGEPVLEVGGPLIHAQILETYILNILGFSIIEASLAARIAAAAQGKPLIDFGLRRAQGPVSSVRAARGAQLAGFSATSNVYAARQLSFPASGTMAHSYIQAHDSEEEAFERFVDMYKENAILLVDTYDSKEGIKKAGDTARKAFSEKEIQIKGIRIDSGDFIELSKYARKYYDSQGLDFIKIFISGNLDEFVIADLISKNAPVDGFGVGTRFTVSHNVPDVDISYKLIRYGKKDVFKTSPDKTTLPGRKSVIREKKDLYIKDTVIPFRESSEDLLKPFTALEDTEAVRQRIAQELDLLPGGVTLITEPALYPVEHRI
jgi:nicotinate phosphoribosyltransferase